jgi:hypothetical protein
VTTMPQDRSGKLRAVVQVASGNFLEMFDFMVFGDYASAIARAYFPSHDGFASLMLSLMTFGAAMPEVWVSCSAGLALAAVALGTRRVDGRSQPSYEEA